MTDDFEHAGPQYLIKRPQQVPCAVPARGDLYELGTSQAAGAGCDFAQPCPGYLSQHAEIERLRTALTEAIASMQRGGFNTDLQQHLRRVLASVHT